MLCNLSFFLPNEILKGGQRIGWVLISLLVTNVPRVIAEPFNKYCLSPVARKPAGATVRGAPGATVPLQERPARLTISTRGELFEVRAERVDTLLLKRVGTPTPLVSVRAPQYDYGQIDALVLMRDGWLWINGGQIDYVARLDRNANPPTLGTPKALPELYTRPCSFWARFWMECAFPLERGVYSRALDRVFITGHRATFWGRPSLTTFEIVGGGAKELPESARGARLVHDAPRLQGVFLQGIRDELFFYDGVAVTSPLSENVPRSAGALTPWYIDSTPSGRIFLTNAGRSRQPVFLKEVKAGPRFRSISVPDTLARSWLSLFQKRDKEPLWGITRQVVLAEIEGAFKPVATVREGALIEGPAGIEQSSDDSISFTVKDQTTGRSTDYRLAREPATGRCAIRLNAGRPVSLAP
jgi:hypothetical protein